MSVGVMEDYKLRDLRASHTLGWVVELEDLKGLSYYYVCPHPDKKTKISC
jgi:hypothetical protein